MTTMPRYYFDTTDTFVAVADAEGMDLAGDEAAIREAMEGLADIAHDIVVSEQGNGASITVRDENGSAIFAVCISVARVRLARADSTARTASGRGRRADMSDRRFIPPPSRPQQQARCRVHRRSQQPKEPMSERGVAFVERWIADNVASEAFFEDGGDARFGELAREALDAARIVGIPPR